MASSLSGQDEPNSALWLATRAGKMELSCPLGTTRCIPQEKCPRKPYNESFITKLVRPRWLDIGLVPFWCVYGTRRRRNMGYWPSLFRQDGWILAASRSINTCMQKELGQHPAILTEQAWSITHISYCFSNAWNHQLVYLIDQPVTNENIVFPASKQFNSLPILCWKCFYDKS